jgi:hypothetical protein
MESQNGVVLNKQMNSAVVLAKNKKNRATSSHLDKPSQKGKMAIEQSKKIKKMTRGREPYHKKKQICIAK